MAKIKRIHHNKYTVIDNTIFDKVDISLQAKGLFCLLLHLPENWSFRETQISTLSKNGRAATRGALEELEKFGFLNRTRVRNSKGQLTSGDWLLDDQGSMGDCTAAAKAARAAEEKKESPNKEQPDNSNEDQSDKSLIKDTYKQLISPMFDNRTQVTQPMFDYPTLDKPTLDKPTLDNRTLLSTYILSKYLNKVSIDKVLNKSSCSYSKKNPTKIHIQPSDRESKPDSPDQQVQIAFKHSDVIVPTSQKKLLKDYTAMLGVETVLHALEVAKAETKYPRVTWNFVRTILERYRSSGITSVEQAIQNEQMFSRINQPESPSEREDRPIIPIYKLGE